MKVARSLKSCRRVDRRRLTSGLARLPMANIFPPKYYSTQMLARLPIANIFPPKCYSTQMLFHPNVIPPKCWQGCQWPIFSTQMLFHYHLLLYIQLFLRHGLSIYHCAVDKGNYCDLYLGWGETHTHSIHTH